MLLHASCIAIHNQGVLLTGPPGIGKSDLALRLIDEGASLISDDQVALNNEDGLLMASAPSTLLGLIEIRHVGIMKFPFILSAKVVLCVHLAPFEKELVRMPEKETVLFLDHCIPQLRLSAFAVSTPAKIRAYLNYKKIE